VNAAGASRRSRAACALRLALWLSLLSLPAAVAAETPERETAAGGGLVLRYGWSADQTWRATHRSERETQLPVGTQRDRGVACFEYRVEPGEPEGTLRLEARLLSQETAEGTSPLDFSPIAFRAQVDALGRLRGAHYQIGEAEPPVVDGARLDPIAFRHMLRQVASAWRGAVFWFPELPERALSPGDAFVVDEARDLAESEPGVKMQMRASRTYRLLGVESGVARFRVEETSEVDAATADSGIASEQRAEGEALFDLSLGMWTRHQLVSSQRASYQGAEGLGAGAGEVSVRSTTSLEMRRLEPETAP
jgi:hypothetical protein